MATRDPSLPTWKTVVLRSAAFGAPFALALSMIAGMLAWYTNRPKPEKSWNQSAIKATCTNVFFRVEANELLYDFRYSLENETDRDYKLPSDAKLFLRLTQDMSYRDVPDMTWEQNLYIPLGQKVNISIKLPVMYSDYNFSRQKADDEKQLMAFSDRRLAEIDGFALFDPNNRYRIDFPNGWPEAAERVKKREESHNYPRVAAKVTAYLTYDWGRVIGQGALPRRGEQCLSGIRRGLGAPCIEPAPCR